MTASPKVRDHHSHYDSTSGDQEGRSKSDGLTDSQTDSQTNTANNRKDKCDSLCIVQFASPTQMNRSITTTVSNGEFIHILIQLVAKIMSSTGNDHPKNPGFIFIFLQGVVKVIVLCSIFLHFLSVSSPLCVGVS